MLSHPTAALCGVARRMAELRGQALNFDALQTRQAQVDAQWVAFCSALSESSLSHALTLRRTEGDFSERVDRVLLHLFEHQIHHRGQIHCMLSGSTVAPPQLDEFFLEADARLRADEMRALGLNEPWG